VHGVYRSWVGMVGFDALLMGTSVALDSPSRDAHHRTDSIPDPSTGSVSSEPR
jgi:hypothetical protein